MKKLISIFVSIIIAATSFIVGATPVLAGESGACGDDLTYTVSDDGTLLTISGSGAMTNYKVAVASRAPWYADYSSTITQVVIGEGVTTIGNYAFYYCDALESISFSGTDVVTIGTYAFRYCTGLKSVDFSNSCVKNINTSAFRDCTALETVNFSTSSLETIGNFAFSNCSSLCYVDFNNSSAKSLGNSAFAGCTKVDWLGLGVIETIGNATFSGCTGTTYWLNIPATTTSIGSNAFYETNFNYNTVANPEMEIGENAFGDGTSSYYARFFSVGGMVTTTFEYVTSYKESNSYNWWYYCLNDNHSYENQPVEATCTEYGYDYFLCPYCNADAKKGDYIAPDHKYLQINSNEDGMFTYSCTDCGLTTIKFSAFEISTRANGLLSIRPYEKDYKQYNYNGKADINGDGVVNTIDFKLISDAIKNTATTNNETTIITNTKYQTIDGFGASAAWWSQDVGGWDNAKDIMTLLYSDEEGIGLNIYRYNVGAGSKSDSTMYDNTRKTYCFLNEDGTYNWNADANAMNALKLAKEAHGDDLQVVLFNNSAPIYMTNNGKAYADSDSNGNAVENLSEDKYDEYAQFVVDVAEHFIEDGYNVVDVSPINEPEWGWNGNGQEGCCWSVASARNFYNNYMIPALKNSTTLNGNVRLSVWESGQVNHSSYWNSYLNYMFSSSTTYKSNNENIRDYCNSAVVHSYWASTTDRQEAKADLSSSMLSAIEEVRCTEYCQMTNDGSNGVYGKIASENFSTNGMDMDYGLALADVIYQDMTILNAVEWNWWTACSQGVYPDALVYVNYNDHSDITLPKRYWCLGNYSKFIEEGAQRVYVGFGSSLGKNLETYKTYSWEDGARTDKNNYFEASAYQNPDGSVVVVYINNSNTPQVTTFSDTFSTFTSYVTDELRDLEQYQSGNATDAVHIPAKSVTTVVLK